MWLWCARINRLSGSSQCVSWNAKPTFGLLKALLVSLLLAASAYGVSKLNLFGLENTSDRLADQVYQRITAADYGADRKGQSAVRVITPR